MSLYWDLSTNSLRFTFGHDGGRRNKTTRRHFIRWAMRSLKATRAEAEAMFDAYMRGGNQQ